MAKIVPDEVFALLEEELCHIRFGKLNLEISVHDNNQKYRITKEISIVPGKYSSGEMEKLSMNSSKEFNK